MGSGRDHSHGCCSQVLALQAWPQDPSRGSWGPRPRCCRLSSGVLPWCRKQEAGRTLWAQQDLR